MSFPTPDGISRVNVTASHAHNTQPKNKLVKAAQEFESVLLQGWLEKMNASFVGSGESDPAHGTIMSLGTEAIASALAARGGIGLASMILRQVGPAAETKDDSGEAIPLDTRT